MPKTEWTGSKRQRGRNVITITGIINNLGRNMIAYVSYENTEYPGVFAVVSPDGLEALFDDERVKIIIYGTLVPNSDGDGAEWVRQ